MKSDHLTLQEPRTPRQLIEVMYGHIDGIVRFVCRSGRHYAVEQEIEDISHEIILLLLENDYRVLRSFDATKSSPTTWLVGVTTRCVANRARRVRRVTASHLDEAREAVVACEPVQETNLLFSERLEKLEYASRSLSDRERKLLRLVRSGAAVSRIASEMGMTICSVYTRKHCLIRKINRMVETAATASGGGQQNT